MKYSLHDTELLHHLPTNINKKENIMSNNNNEITAVTYEKHIETLAELAKVKDASKALIRKIQGHWGVGDYFTNELQEVIHVLKLPLSVDLGDGVIGYYDRVDALMQIGSDVIWSAEHKVWIAKDIKREIN